MKEYSFSQRFNGEKNLLREVIKHNREELMAQNIAQRAYQISLKNAGLHGNFFGGVRDLDQLQVGVYKRVKDEADRSGMDEYGVSFTNNNIDFVMIAVGRGMVPTDDFAEDDICLVKQLAEEMLNRKQKGELPHLDEFTLSQINPWFEVDKSAFLSPSAN